MQSIIKKINEDLPLHSLWDGFWVYYFKRGTLIIAGSFNRIYYRDFDIVFKKVSFFNIPAEWRDTDIKGDDLIRLADKDEFAKQFPDFDVQDKFIFAIDIYFRNVGEEKTFYIVAEHIYLNKCTPEDNSPGSSYVDPFADEPFPCFKNRVV